MRMSLGAMTLVVASVLAGPSNAALGTYTYTVTGSDFTGTSGTPPFTSITESVSIAFDTSMAVSQITSGITQNPSDITPTSPLAYTYIPIADELIIGGLAQTVTTADPKSTDFALVIGNASMPNFTVTSLSYSTGNGSVFSAQTLGSVTTTPEPASIAVIGSTLAMVALIRRRR